MSKLHCVVTNLAHALQHLCMSRMVFKAGIHPPPPPRARVSKPATHSGSFTLRTRSSTSRCPAWSPWLKLNRATFMPASIRAARPSSDQQDGPRVHTILVLRGVFTGAVIKSRPTCGWKQDT
jgi:hypothetical protein